MEIIQRFCAATNERRFWSLAWAAVGAWIIVRGLLLWSLPWTASMAAVGLLILASSLAHELYRHRWGTISLMALCLLAVLATMALLAVGVMRYAPIHLVAPALCLVGVVSFWRDRPRDTERYLVPAQVSRYIAGLRRDLRRIRPETPFHAVTDRDFLGQVREAATWLAEVYDDAAKDFRVTAVYVEMNRFDINTDRWFLNGFAFKMPPAALLRDLEFNLGEYETSPESEFVLAGMEDLQRTFEETDEGKLIVSKTPEDRRLLDAMGTTFDLITARMQELVAAAHEEAGRRGHPVGAVRVLANAHDTLWVPLCCPARRTSRPAT